MGYSSSFLEFVLNFEGLEDESGVAPRLQFHEQVGGFCNDTLLEFPHADKRQILASPLNSHTPIFDNR